MNTDIRIKTTFLTHHKTLRLRKKLGSDGVLSLIALWLYVAQYRPDGDISDMSHEDIAAVALWEKDPHHFLTTLIAVGFVDEHLNKDGSITRTIHDWAEHNAYAANAKARSELAKSLALRRWNKKQETLDRSQSNANGNAIGNAPRNALGNAPIPIPNPIPIPDPNRYIDMDSHDVCTQSDKSDFVPVRSTQKIVFDEKECSFKGTEAYIQLWQAAYPAVDVIQELKAMEAWVASQPKSRWKKDWRRFITNWLSREQDKAELRMVKAGGNGRRFLDD